MRNPCIRLLKCFSNINKCVILCSNFKLKIVMKKAILSMLLLCCIIAVQAQVSKTIDVTTAGTLSSLLTAQEKSIITNLTVTGNVDARDVKCMRDEIINLAVLDINSVIIQAYTGVNGTYTGSVVYPQDEMPLSSFLQQPNAPKLSLISVTLPNSLKSIANYAFSSCCNLAPTIILPSLVSSIGNYAFYGCSGLKTIISMNFNPPYLQGEYVFNKSTLEKIFVPIEGIAVYKQDISWYNISKFYILALAVSTQPTTSISFTSSLLNANIESFSISPISVHGFCWNKTGSPTIADSLVNNGAKTTLGAYSNTISGLTPGTKYYVKAYATDGERTVYGNEVTFTTASLPSAAGVISGLTTVCQGQTSVTYTVPAIPSATSYVWTLSDGIKNTSSTNSITVKYERYFTSGTISVKGRNEWGDGTASSIDITANLLPANAGVITGNNVVCQGESDVTYTTPAIANATSYIWTLPNGVIGTSTTNSITVIFSNAAITGNITVKGHNDCGDGGVSLFYVTVNQQPVLNLTSKTGIPGESIQLNPSITYTGSGTLTYRWSPKDGLNDSTISNPTATLIKPMTYTLTVTSSNGCSATAQMTVGLTKMTAPAIGIVGISNNKNIVVWNKAVSTGIDAYNIYRETNVSNQFDKVGSVSYDSLSVFVDAQSSPEVQSNKYKISILDKNGVESDQSAAHKTIYLSIYKGNGSAWSLIWEAYEGFAVSTYNIYRGTSADNLALIGSTSGSRTQYNDVNAPAGNVFYQLEVINPNSVAPSKVSAVAENITSGNSAVGINYSASRSNIASNVYAGLGTSKADNLEVYPNPCKSQVFVNVRIDGNENYSIIVTNAVGQRVYFAKLLTDKLVLDVAKFGNQGLYFMQVVDGMGMTVGSKTLVVE